MSKNTLKLYRYLNAYCERVVMVSLGTELINTFEIYVEQNYYYYVISNK
jgi:hypothetical protein